MSGYLNDTLVKQTVMSLVPAPVTQVQDSGQSLFGQTPFSGVNTRSGMSADVFRNRFTDLRGRVQSGSSTMQTVTARVTVKPTNLDRNTGALGQSQVLFITSKTHTSGRASKKFVRVLSLSQLNLELFLLRDQYRTGKDVLKKWKFWGVNRNNTDNFDGRKHAFKIQVAASMFGRTDCLNYWRDCYLAEDMQGVHPGCQLWLGLVKKSVPDDYKEYGHLPGGKDNIITAEDFDEKTPKHDQTFDADYVSSDTAHVNYMRGAERAARDLGSTTVGTDPRIASSRHRPSGRPRSRRRLDFGVEEKKETDTYFTFVPFITRTKEVTEQDMFTGDITSGWKGGVIHVGTLSYTTQPFEMNSDLTSSVVHPTGPSWVNQQSLLGSMEINVRCY